jgi:uncharacterized membrane protein YhaH (DUF805 family)
MQDYFSQYMAEEARMNRLEFLVRALLALIFGGGMFYFAYLELTYAASATNQSDATAMSQAGMVIGLIGCVIVIAAFKVKFRQEGQYLRRR